MVIPWRRIVRSDGEWLEERRLVIRRCVANIHAVVGPAERRALGG